MYRLYVDEVGDDGLVRVAEAKHRYLSLTGVAMKRDHARDYLVPKFDQIKRTIFRPDPDEPQINFHRKDIIGLKGPFEILRQEDVRARFDQQIIEVFRNCEYAVITALIDKQWMLLQDHWVKTHPYHFLMEVLVEKYTQFLERKGDIGDIMPEGRRSKKDGKLQEAFELVRNNGTRYVLSDRVQSAIRSKNLKFRYKIDNIAGLQLCDLIAHPSHMHTRRHMGHEVTLAPFAEKIKNILVQSKYDRSVYGTIGGYGVKHLP